MKSLFPKSMSLFSPLIYSHLLVICFLFATIEHWRFMSTDDLFDIRQFPFLQQKRLREELELSQSESVLEKMMASRRKEASAATSFPVQEKSPVAIVVTSKPPLPDNQFYSNTAYQPMLELLQYLRDNDFKTYLSSGGGIDYLCLVDVWAFRDASADHQQQFDGTRLVVADREIVPAQLTGAGNRSE